GSGPVAVRRVVRGGFRTSAGPASCALNRAGHPESGPVGRVALTRCNFLPTISREISIDLNGRLHGVALHRTLQCRSSVPDPLLHGEHVEMRAMSPRAQPE